MYVGFYGLRTEPFHITPDPDFLYLSPSHREALASVIYGVQERKGFIAVTGEVGTGKTTILRSYLKQVHETSVRAIYLFNPNLTFYQVQLFLLHELGVDIRGITQATALRTLHMALVEAFRRNETIVFIIDEAQNMPAETLEQLRMLSNLETTKEKLLQVVLVGQPELDATLNQHSLRQLKQRIAIHTVIRPLSRKESREYINHRLARAGGEDAIFTPGAIRTLVRRGRGIPRMLNILCDNAMIAGFGSRRRPVTAHLVRQAAAELNRKAGRRWLVWRSRLTVAGLITALAVLAVAGQRAIATDGHAATPAFRTEIADDQPVTARVAVPGTEPALPSAPLIPDTSATPTPAPTPDSSPWENTPQVIAALDHIDKLTPSLDIPAPPAAATTESKPPQPAAEAPAPISVAMDAAMPADPQLNAEGGGLTALDSTALPALDAVPAPVPVAAPAPAITLAATPAPAPASSLEGQKRMVQEGDSLVSLAQTVYGKYDATILQGILAHNPSITNPDHILAGSMIVFPDVMTSPPNPPAEPGVKMDGTGS